MRLVTRLIPRLIPLCTASALSLGLAACNDQPAPDPAEIQKDQCPSSQAHASAIRLDGDDLIVTADYGGCHQAALWVCWGGSFAPSDPPQVAIAVSHDDAGTCDQLQTTTTTISLRPMLDELQAWTTGSLRVEVLGSQGLEVLWQPH